MPQIKKNNDLNLDSLNFSVHSVERFMERTECNDEKMAIRNMKSILRQAKRARRKNFVHLFFKYNQIEAKYYVTRKWIFVIIEKEVATCYRKEPNEIKSMYKPLEK